MYVLLPGAKPPTIWHKITYMEYWNGFTVSAITVKFNSVKHYTLCANAHAINFSYYVHTYLIVTFHNIHIHQKHSYKLPNLVVLLRTNDTSTFKIKDCNTASSGVKIIGSYRSSTHITFNAHYTLI